MMSSLTFDLSHDSGGITLTFEGMNFDSVTEPEIVFSDSPAMVRGGVM